MASEQVLPSETMEELKSRSTKVKRKITPAWKGQQGSGFVSVMKHLAKRVLLPDNHMEFNRKILSFVSRLGLIPFNFEQGGTRISGRVSKVGFFFFKILLFLSIVYSVYISVMLILSLLIASEFDGHGSLGVHINRAFLTSTMSFWAYEIYLVKREGHNLLYNSVQTSQGEISQLLHVAYKGFRFQTMD